MCGSSRTVWYTALSVRVRIEYATAAFLISGAVTNAEIFFRSNEVAAPFLRVPIILGLV